MFEPGEKVVCVNVDPVTAQTSLRLPNTINLVKGRIYTVQAFYPAGTRHAVIGPKGPQYLNILTPGVSVGVLDPYGWDIWMATRFRKIIKRDISLGLALLKGLNGLGSPKLVEAA